MLSLSAVPWRQNLLVMLLGLHAYESAQELLQKKAAKGKAAGGAKQQVRGESRSVAEGPSSVLQCAAHVMCQLMLGKGCMSMCAARNAWPAAQPQLLARRCAHHLAPLPCQSLTMLCHCLCNML